MNLSFMAHGCVGAPPGSAGKSVSGDMAALRELGFDVPLVKHIKSADEIAAVIEEVDKKRDSLPYESDGIVFTVNRVALHAELGANPGGARGRVGGRPVRIPRRSSAAR